MSAVLTITGPIFALVALGYLVARFSLFGPAELRALGRYVVMLALPALIFRALTTVELAALIEPAYLAAYLGGSLLTLGIGYGLSRRAGLDGTSSTFQAMGMSCANTGFIGYPVLLMAIPAVADRALALNMIVENLVLIPLILILAERGREEEGPRASRIAGRVLTNPLVLALAAGIVVALTPLALPQAFDQAIELLARSSAAVSLVVIGGALAGTPPATQAVRVAAVVAGKLVLHPLAVGGAFLALGLAGVAVDPDLVAAGVLLAAMPTMAIYPILAAQYGQGAPAAVAMLMMTIIAFFTLGVLLWSLGLLPG
jgi:malonate transporter and related proteins